MKLQLLLDEQNYWIICLEVNKEEREAILKGQTSVKISSGLNIDTRDTNLLMISNDYSSDVIDPTAFSTLISFLTTNNYLNKAEASKFQEQYEEFYPLQLQLRQIQNNIPSPLILQTVFATNNPDLLHDAYQDRITKLEKQRAALETIFKQLPEKNSFEKYLHDNFVTLIKNTYNIINDREQSIKNKVAEKIKFLTTNANYIVNINPEKQFNHLISNLKPLKHKEALLKNSLLDEKSNLARYRIKDKSLSSISNLISSQEIIKGITLYRIDARDNEEKRQSKETDIHIYKDASQVALFEVEFSNGKKAFYEINPNIASINELEELFIAHGANIDLSSGSRGVGPLKEMFKEGLRGYTPEIENDYKTIHKKLANQFVESINDAQAVEVVFIGCGKGEEIKPIVQILEQKKLPYRIYAIDIDKGNINIAKENLRHNKNIIFVADNATNIDQFIEVGREKFTNFYKNNPKTIAISSGCLTRKVNKDQAEAFDIFKKTANFVDTILISGRTATLIAKRDAKKAGLDNKQILYASPESSAKSPNRTLDIYTFKSLDKKIAEVLSDKSKEINFSEYARPFAVLKAIDKETKEPNFWQGKIINLNDAYFSPKEIKKFAKFAYERELTIAVNGNEPWLATLQSEINKQSSTKFKMFKSAAPKTVEIFITKQPHKHTKYTDESTEIFERKKISDNLEQRAKDSLDEEKQTRKKSF